MRPSRPAHPLADMQQPDTDAQQPEEARLSETPLEETETETATTTPQNGQQHSDGAAAVTSGFRRSWRRFSVPQIEHDDGFFGAYSANGTRWFQLLDLDGDGFKDIIHTGDTSRNNGFVWRDEVGPYWRLYRGSATGFADTLTDGSPKVD